MRYIQGEIMQFNKEMMQLNLLEEAMGRMS